MLPDVNIAADTFLWEVRKIQNGLRPLASDRAVGPGGQLLIPVAVDYSQSFTGSDQETWEAEYKANVRTCAVRIPRQSHFGADERDLYGCSFPDDWLEELQDMEPEERQYLLGELAGFNNAPAESEVFNEIY